MTFPSWAKGIRNWLTLLVASYAVAAAAGIDVPRPAWINEHRVLAGTVKENTVRIIEGTVESLQRQLTELKIQKSKVPPGALYDELTRSEAILRAQLSDTRARLRKVRGF